MDSAQTGEPQREPTVRVLVNEQDQYGLLPLHIAIPPGWSSTGVEGTTEACLAFVEATWTDMRPRGIRGGARNP